MAGSPKRKNPMRHSGAHPTSQSNDETNIFALLPAGLKALGIGAEMEADPKILAENEEIKKAMLGGYPKKTEVAVPDYTKPLQPETKFQVPLRMPDNSAPADYSLKPTLNPYLGKTQQNPYPDGPWWKTKNKRRAWFDAQAENQLDLSSKLEEAKYQNDLAVGLAQLQNGFKLGQLKEENRLAVERGLAEEVQKRLTNEQAWNLSRLPKGTMGDAGIIDRYKKSQEPFLGERFFDVNTSVNNQALGESLVEPDFYTRNQEATLLTPEYANDATAAGAALNRAQAKRQGIIEASPGTGAFHVDRVTPTISVYNTKGTEGTFGENNTYIPGSPGALIEVDRNGDEIRINPKSAPKGGTPGIGVYRLPGDNANKNNGVTSQISDWWNTPSPKLVPESTATGFLPSALNYVQNLYTKLNEVSPNAIEQVRRLPGQVNQIYQNWPSGKQWKNMFWNVPRSTQIDQGPIQQALTNASTATALGPVTPNAQPSSINFLALTPEEQEELIRQLIR